MIPDYRPHARALLALSALWLALWWCVGCDTIKDKASSWWAQQSATEEATESPVPAGPGEGTTLPAVNPESAQDAGDALDPALVTWDEPAGDLSKWEANVALSDVKAEGGKFSWSQTGATWKAEQKAGWDRPAIGNVLVIAQCGGKWHGAAWDWIGPGVRRKDLPDFATTNALHGPCLEAWVPASGEKICWMLSSFARGHLDLTVKQRSTIACTVWP